MWSGTRPDWDDRQCYMHLLVVHLRAVPASPFPALGAEEACQPPQTREQAMPRVVSSVSRHALPLWQGWTTEGTSRVAIPYTVGDNPDRPHATHGNSPGKGGGRTETWRSPGRPTGASVVTAPREGGGRSAGRSSGDRTPVDVSSLGALGVLAVQFSLPYQATSERATPSARPCPAVASIYGSAMREGSTAADHDQ